MGACRGVIFLAVEVDDWLPSQFQPGFTEPSGPVLAVP